MFCSSCMSSQCPCLEVDNEEVEEIEIDEFENKEPISAKKLDQIINSYFNG